MRDQCVETVAATTTSVRAPIRAPATKRVVELAVKEVFTALTSMLRRVEGRNLKTPDSSRNK